MDGTLSSTFVLYIYEAIKAIIVARYTKVQISFFFLNWANPGLFFVYFRSFQTNNTIFATNQCEKMSCPSSIWRRDSNP